MLGVAQPHLLAHRLVQLLDDRLLADDGFADRRLQRAEARELGLDAGVGRGVVHGVSRGCVDQLFSAYMTMLTANFVLSSARKRLLRQS